MNKKLISLSLIQHSAFIVRMWADEEMNMKRTKEITIIHYRRRVKKSRAVPVEGCPVCGSSSEMITVTAARVSGVSRSTLDAWIASQQVHATRSLNGQLFVCRRSLSERVASGAPGLREMPAQERPNPPARTRKPY